MVVVSQEITQRVDMQSFLNSTEEQITSTHMHKLQVSFHGRAIGNITRQKVKMTAPQFVWEDVQYLRAITSQEHQKGKGWQKDIPTKKVTQRHFSGQVRTFSKGYQAQTDATEECWTKQGKMQNSECLLYLFGNRTPIFQQSLRWTQLKQPISNTGQY